MDLPRQVMGRGMRTHFRILKRWAHFTHSKTGGTTMAIKWQLAGTYFETCNCEVACPCVFLSAPTTGECTLLVGWHIERGSFDNVPLDGLNVALAAHTPGH